MLEIELKVAVPDLNMVRTRLNEQNAVLIGRVHEHDIYYNAPHRDFGRTDEAIRVRYTNDHAVITYKGAKIKTFGLKAREELNSGVESGAVFETILTVDELGTFVEIEVIAESEDSDAAIQIEKISKEIGVHGEPILASYLELLLTKRSAVQP